MAFSPKPQQSPQKQNRRAGPNERRRRPSSGRPEERSQRSQEFDHKILSVRRVTRVVAGGRRFSFSVALVVGNKKGAVGVGLAKASDTSSAIEKATRNARKNLIRPVTTALMSIAYPVSAKYSASKVELRPAPKSGLVAGSAARHVLELAGITDINAKILSRSHNQLNNARATIEALRKLSNH